MAESCHLLKMTGLSCFMNTDSNDLSVNDTTRSAARWIPNQKTKCWNEDSTGSTFGLNLSWVTQTLGLSTMEVSSDTALQMRWVQGPAFLPISSIKKRHTAYILEHLLCSGKKSILQFLLMVLKEFLLRSQSPSHVFFFRNILNFLSWSSNPKQVDRMKAALLLIFIKQLGVSYEQESNYTRNTTHTLCNGKLCHSRCSQCFLSITVSFPQKKTQH